MRWGYASLIVPTWSQKCKYVLDVCKRAWGRVYASLCERVCVRVRMRVCVCMCV
jgi:hypothetical protein